MQSLLGYSTESINEFLLKVSLRGIERLHPHQVKQASPITPEILLNMYEFLDASSTKDMVFWCLFLFAFFSFARKSNLVPDNDTDISNPRFLLRKDVELINDRLIITMRWSKTVWTKDFANSFIAYSGFSFMSSSGISKYVCFSCSKSF